MKFHVFFYPRNIFNIKIEVNMYIYKCINYRVFSHLLHHKYFLLILKKTKYFLLSPDNLCLL